MLSRPFQNRYWRLRVDLKSSLCLHAWLKATELASWHPRPARQLRAGARYWQDRRSGLPVFPLSTRPLRVEIALGLILLTEKPPFQGCRCHPASGALSCVGGLLEYGIHQGKPVFCDRREKMLSLNNKEIWKNFSSINGLSAFHSREEEVSFLFGKFKIRKH